MGEVIPNTRFVKRTPAQRARLRRKFAQRPATSSARKGVVERKDPAPPRRR